MSFARYEQAPSDVQQKVMEENAKEEQAEEKLVLINILLIIIYNNLT